MSESKAVIQNTKTSVVSDKPIEIRQLVYVIRGIQVMLDSDLAMLYQVETGA